MSGGTPPRSTPARKTLDFDELTRDLDSELDEKHVDVRPTFECVTPAKKTCLRTPPRDPVAERDTHIVEQHASIASLLPTIGSVPLSIDDSEETARLAGRDRFLWGENGEMEIPRA